VIVLQSKKAIDNSFFNISILFFTSQG